MLPSVNLPSHLLTMCLPSALLSSDEQSHKVVWASGGKMHSLAVTDKGDAFAWGSNKHGQLGTGSLSSEVALTPVKSSVTGAQRCAAGAEFSVWLCDGSLFSAGLPQYGQARCPESSPLAFPTLPSTPSILCVLRFAAACVCVCVLSVRRPALTPTRADVSTLPAPSSSGTAQTTSTTPRKARAHDTSPLQPSTAQRR